MEKNNNQFGLTVEKSQEIDGWVSAGDGWYYPLDGLDQSNDFFTEDFEIFARRSRARWDFLEYVKEFFNKKRDC